ncbi:unnamed protein product [Blepharisma stoltei]|uniref:Uncharacterized protein n=1 Tax=Blepharisma stoltei TaxID=1481888 RepID=A0AAU9J3F0_9CILI|nr:unnamed protein product [Blepharisma stoltei]
MQDNTERKQISEGLELIVIKDISHWYIEFYLENLTDFLYIVQFMLIDLRNVSPIDDQLTKKVQVLPNESLKLSELRIEGSFSYKYQFVFQKLNIEPLIKFVEVHKGLRIKITQYDLEHRITFELVNEHEGPVHFELKFNHTKGVKTENGMAHFSLDASAKSTSLVCVMHFSGEWGYKYDYKYRLLPHSIDLSRIQEKLNMDASRSWKFKRIDVESTNDSLFGSLPKKRKTPQRWRR